ncbi:hypothetical protein KC950_03140, partial [Candidatus Saccharibacteria bacterium]|nr:hypothetical protein [Candidatus Saccharibacteria bacterium]
MNDTLNTPAPMSDEQRAIDDMSQENLSQEDREALGQLQSELNQDRIDALPRGNPVHLDAQGNVLTE